MKLYACLVFAFLSGALSVLGWAPFGYWPLTVIGAAGLFWLISNSKTTLQSTCIGLAFGIGLHLVGQNWIFVSLHDKTGMPAIPAALASIIFVVYLALFSAFPCLIWHALFKPQEVDGTTNRPPNWQIFAVLSYAALFSLCEWLRSMQFFYGFTSLSFGYSLIDTWLAGYVPIGGIYGLSAIGFCLSGLLTCLISGNRISRMLALILIGIIASIGLALNQIAWTKASGIPLSYRLIQPNITQNHKFDPIFANTQRQLLIGLIEQKPADLIVTPETTFEIHLNELPAELMSRLQQFSHQTRSHIFLGILTLSTNSDGYNSLIQIAPNQTRMAQYNKVRLMPFGEYSPTGFRWFSDELNIPFKDMSTGSINQAPFTVGLQRVGTMICYEDGSGQDARHWLPEASFILNPSNLAWFDDSFAIDQNLQMARMRALEIGRPILRTTNTGITAHIDHLGNVIKRLASQKQGVLEGMVQPVQGMTPYTRWGNWVPVLGSAIYLALIKLIHYLRRNHPIILLRKSSTKKH